MSNFRVSRRLRKNGGPDGHMLQQRFRGRQHEFRFTSACCRHLYIQLYVNVRRCLSWPNISRAFSFELCAQSDTLNSPEQSRGLQCQVDGREKVRRGRQMRKTKQWQIPRVSWQYHRNNSTLKKSRQGPSHYHWHGRTFAAIDSMNPVDSGTFICGRNIFCVDHHT